MSIESPEVWLCGIPQVTFAFCCEGNPRSGRSFWGSTPAEGWVRVASRRKGSSGRRDGRAYQVSREVAMTQPFEVGVVVRDLEVLERFYREVLGCVPVRHSRIPHAIGGPAGLGGPLLVVWLQVPSGGRIKLIRLRADADADVDADADAGAAARPSAVPLAARRGLSYVTFHFDDIVPVVAALLGRRCPAAVVPDRRGGAGPADQLLGGSGGQRPRTRGPARR